MMSQHVASRIEFWPLDKLVPFEKNARTHSDAQIAQIAASIAAFGFNSPILVDGHAGIIAGHGRLLAARKLEFSQVPVIVRCTPLSVSRYLPCLARQNRLRLANRARQYNR
jgi:ParB-like chromosome segregation protein Spo0J